MQVKLDIFEGPLDLLLYLIKRNDIDICNIPIAQVTQQYLEYLELMQLLNVNVAAEFMVVAATLIEIKSKMLLPQPELEEATEEDDPRDELVKRLLEYKKFKDAAEKLKDLEYKRKQVYIRPATFDDDGETYFEASLFDLITSFTKALKDIPREIFYEVIKDEVTVEQKMEEVLLLFTRTKKILISELFENSRNKLEIVATFLAILELIRLNGITIRQKELFGPVEIVRNKTDIRISPIAEPAPSVADVVVEENKT